MFDVSLRQNAQAQANFPASARFAVFGFHPAGSGLDLAGSFGAAFLWDGFDWSDLTDDLLGTACPSARIGEVVALALNGVGLAPNNCAVSDPDLIGAHGLFAAISYDVKCSQINTFNNPGNLHYEILAPIIFARATAARRGFQEDRFNGRVIICDPILGGAYHLCPPDPASCLFR